MTEEQKCYLAERVAGRSRTLQECSLLIGRESSSQVQRDRLRGKVEKRHVHQLESQDVFNTGAQHSQGMTNNILISFFLCVRSTSSLKANTDVFAFENWATLYKQQIITASFSAHYTNIIHYKHFWCDIISSSLISQENFRQSVICQINQ